MSHALAWKCVGECSVIGDLVLSTKENVFFSFFKESCSYLILVFFLPTPTPLKPRVAKKQTKKKKQKTKLTNQTKPRKTPESGKGSKRGISYANIFKIVFGYHNWFQNIKLINFIYLFFLVFSKKPKEYLRAVLLCTESCSSSYRASILPRGERGNPRLCSVGLNYTGIPVW